MIVSYCRYYGLVMWYYNDKMELKFWESQYEDKSGYSSLSKVRKSLDVRDIIFDDGAE